MSIPSWRPVSFSLAALTEVVGVLVDDLERTGNGLVD
jgi:hypothetical protein